MLTLNFFMMVKSVIEELEVALELLPDKATLDEIKTIADFQ
jgi:hypothetical protein